MCSGNGFALKKTSRLLACKLAGPVRRPARELLQYCVPEYAYPTFMEKIRRQKKIARTCGSWAHFNNQIKGMAGCRILRGARLHRICQGGPLLFSILAGSKNPFSLRFGALLGRLRCEQLLTRPVSSEGISSSPLCSMPKKSSWLLGVHKNCKIKVPDHGPYHVQSMGSRSGPLKMGIGSPPRKPERLALKDKRMRTDDPEGYWGTAV
jgi:hypothetical protein